MDKPRMSLLALGVTACACWAITGTMAGDQQPARSASVSTVQGNVHPVPGGQGVGFQGGAAVSKPSLAVVPGRKFTALRNASGAAAFQQPPAGGAPTPTALLESEAGGEVAPAGMVRPLASGELQYFPPGFDTRAVSDCWLPAAECGDLVYSNTMQSGYFAGFYYSATCSVVRMGDDVHLVPGSPRKVCRISVAVAGTGGDTMTVTCQLYASCSAGVLSGPIAGTDATFTGIPRDGTGQILTWSVNVVTLPDNMWLGIVCSPFDTTHDGGPLLCGPAEGPGSSSSNYFSMQFSGTGCAGNFCYVWFGDYPDLNFYVQMWAREDDPVGACCDGTLSGSCTCSDITLSLCNATEGVFVGAGTTCADTMPACGRGACWYGSCSCADDTTQAKCAGMGGFEFKLGEVCDACNHNCCKGDTNLDTRVNGEDIPPFIDRLVFVPECTTAEWCAANMDDDLCVDMVDLNLFVSALLSGDGCGTPG